MIRTPEQIKAYIAYLNACDAWQKRKYFRVRPMNRNLHGLRNHSRGGRA